MKDISNILMACVVFHNMIIEDEQDLVVKSIYHSRTNVQVQAVQPSLLFQNLLDGVAKVQDRTTHYACHNDHIVTMHIWRAKGESNLWVKNVQDIIETWQ